MLGLLVVAFFGTFFVPLAVVVWGMWTARLRHGRGRPLAPGQPVLVVRPRD